MVLRIIIRVLVCLALSSPAIADDVSDYVAGIGDLPLMDGLTEDPDSAIIYDKPEGRIVEAVAHGNVTSDDVESFYRTTLTQLGWQATGDNLSFSREGELLTIDVVEQDSGTVVSFSLAPL